MIIENIGNRIKELRIAKGMTQGDLAKKIGVKQAAVAQFEDTKNPRISTLLKVATALEVELTDITGTVLNDELMINDSDILEYLSKLNDQGKKEILHYLKLLIDTPKYRKEND